MTRYTGYDASIYDYVARYSEHFKHKNIGADQVFSSCCHGFFGVE